MQVDAEARAYDALAQHPRIADLVAIARASMTSAFEARRPDAQPERVAQLAAELKVSRQEADTPFGNALAVLERGPEDDAESALACALAAHAVAMHPPRGRDDEARAADELLWLAAHTAFDATGLLDRALGDAATGMWDAVVERIRRIDRRTLPSLGRGEALVGAVALAAGAAKQAAALAAEVRDPKVARVLGAAREASPPAPLSGELAPAPRGPIATALLAMTGVLLVEHLARLVGRLALAYRKPAEVVLADDGAVRVRWRTEMLGRTLRDRDVVVPRTALVRATREVRYPRLATYAGLLALAIGSYLGVSAFVDGVRAASPSLLASGLAIVTLGLALDFVLSSLAPGARGRCRVLLVPRDGAKLCVAGVDTRSADALLARLVQGARNRAP